ncbi:MAG: enoyl-CoA hydratase/isomerase family protein [Deltaproteobacteria bacterium]|nr:enoyl-CoA hydratase/isomerase family protein [Deltaproteobacteria bacterium]
MTEDTSYSGFKLERGEISTLTFNRTINVFSSAVLESFIEAVSALAENTKVLVITAEGVTFMAGADIKEMSSFTPDKAREFAVLFHRAMDTVEGFPGPVIAGVNGFALGGGCELVLASDIVIASGSSVFGQPEINLGIIPGGGGTWRLKRRVGSLRAKELILTGRRVGAEEALGMGLVNKVVTRDKLMEEVASLAKALAGKPIQCLEAAKRLINSGSPDKEIEAFSMLFSYDDRERLMRDFLKKK